MIGLLLTLIVYISYLYYRHLRRTEYFGRRRIPPIEYVGPVGPGVRVGVKYRLRSRQRRVDRPRRVETSGIL